MKQYHVDNTEKFTSIDDIIHFYTQTLQHSESHNESLDKEGTKHKKPRRTEA